ncbi:Gfo/Idh/MocA family protein [Lacticaseibacillus yichunensis]|uniref:Gfo/Idh/MocA family protein n=2 Tax=Lacticaseibacillus TaxID=2759736 RepID=A0ABW4CPC3_9LACO|nr:Gfo/Idh/MocA family oxidoreductase [Lacticaseibacillus yichunensis]
MTQVRFGIIGIGNMGSAHATSITGGQVPELQLVAVADRRASRRQWAAETLPADVTVFSEGKELIASGLVDAVLIAVPHYQHPELAEDAFAHGLHVLSEKPAGVYTKQVREENAAAAKSGLTFAMMFNQRTNSVYRKMHDIVQGGEFGAIMRVNWIITDWFRTQAYYDSGDWRGTWNGEGGGVLLNQCPHQLDLLQWICGMPSEIQAFAQNGHWHDIEVEDDVTAYLKYPNGATGVFVTSTGDYPGTNRFEVTMERGKIVCDGGRLTLFRLDENIRDVCQHSEQAFARPVVHAELVETDGSNPQHVGILRNFGQHLLTGAPLIARGEEGINGLTVSNMIHLSSWLGRPVTAPIDEDLFLAELNERRAASHAKKAGSDVAIDLTDTY